MGINRKSAKQCVGPGWAKLIDKLYDKKPRRTNVLQVKEKFGTLRFYVGSSTDEYFDLISEVERESATVCEFCGKPGLLRSTLPWILTLCDDCLKERVK